MNRLLVSSGATGVLFSTNHPLFVRRERDPRKEKEVALRSSARRLVRSLTYVSLLLASAAAIADNPPLPTQIVDLANKVDGVHPCERRCRGRHLQSLVRSCTAEPRNAIQRQSDSGDRALL
jgi:hypothetical protein